MTRRRTRPQATARRLLVERTRRRFVRSHPLLRSHRSAEIRRPWPSLVELHLARREEAVGPGRFYHVRRQRLLPVQLPNWENYFGPSFARGPAPRPVFGRRVSPEQTVRQVLTLLPVLQAQRAWPRGAQAESVVSKRREAAAQVRQQRIQAAWLPARNAPVAAPEIRTRPIRPSS